MAEDLPIQIQEDQVPIAVQEAQAQDPEIAVTQVQAVVPAQETELQEEALLP